MGLRDSAKSAAAKYKVLTESAPEAKLALDLHPVSGMVTSLTDAAAAAAEERYGDALGEAIGLIPGVKPLAAWRKASKAHDAAKKAADIARTVDRTSDSVSYGEAKFSQSKGRYARGGMVKKPKSAGVASRGWGRAKR